jgi:nitroimidazol reductase NimA-like FMN-containing flavoprotein (pyridoxamine 5'-phosphate oxidase superfamily)
MIKFSEAEKKFLNSLEECRIATAHDKIPHVKPVSFLFEDGKFYIATDYGTRMYKNLVKNPKTALSIDIYKLKGHKAVLVQGNVTILENGAEFKRIYKKFFEKFEWVRNEPWKENEAPIIEIAPTTKTSWGLR